MALSAAAASLTCCCYLRVMLMHFMCGTLKASVAISKATEVTPVSSRCRAQHKLAVDARASAKKDLGVYIGQGHLTCSNAF